MLDGRREMTLGWLQPYYVSWQPFTTTSYRTLDTHLAQSCCRGWRGGVFKAGHSWISFLPSSFPLAFSYLSVWPGHRRSETTQQREEKIQQRHGCAVTWPLVKGRGLKSELSRAYRWSRPSFRARVFASGWTHIEDVDLWLSRGL